MKLSEYIRKSAFKIVICGDGGVGKTAIGKRLTGRFNKEENLKMTPGVDFHSMKINNNVIDCQIWDLGGQEQFRDFQEDFFHAATVVILIFSVDMYHTFKNIKSWLSIIPKERVAKIYLIGNKIDLNIRSVGVGEALKFAEVNQLNYFELSAVTGVGFDDFKQDLTHTVAEIYLGKI